MKVEFTTAAAGQLTPDRTAKPANPTLTPAATEDRTTLRSTVQSLTAQALASPETRQSTVDTLRQAVDNGAYKPDAGHTADAIATQETR